MGVLHRMLGHPLTRDLPVDDPRTTLLRRTIVREKRFLRAIYAEWYAHIIGALEEKDYVLELGAGAGFLVELLPGVIASELFETHGIGLVADACALPIADKTLDAIVMTDVFHHIPDASRFLHEATRCVRSGGKMVMIEPWPTPWSEWVYKNLHSEPFDPGANWEIPGHGPLSGANGALPWIVFQRDRALFKARHPEWQIKNIVPMMPLAYLLSGGVSLRSLMPRWMYRPIRRLERLSNEASWAMFALIELELA